MTITDILDLYHCLKGLGDLDAKQQVFIATIWTMMLAGTDFTKLPQAEVERLAAMARYL